MNTYSLIFLIIEWLPASSMIFSFFILKHSRKRLLYTGTSVDDFLLSWSNFFHLLDDLLILGAEW
jgi:hypothetical protein